MDAATLLRRARKRSGLTQREVAARAGLTQPVVAAYEAGRRQPTIPMLEKLLAACGEELDVQTRPALRLPDPARANRILLAIADLPNAMHLPPVTKPLSFPPLPRLERRRA
jgi:transcriptional regulator with XRE-family HTH domain